MLLLLDEPRRLSTDIDIIVEPGTDVDEFIQRAGTIFPFLSVEEKIRKVSNNIKKRHFRFHFQSPRTGREINILLDVVFEFVSSAVCNRISKLRCAFKRAPFHFGNICSENLLHFENPGVR